MIKIERGPCPPILEDSPATGKRYQLPSVKNALSAMQHGKCCYCETKLVKYIQDVEHFRPKEQYPKLANTWENLLRACRPCNGTKGDSFPAREDNQPLLLDPSDPNIDPEAVHPISWTLSGHRNCDATTVAQSRDICRGCSVADC